MKIKSEYQERKSRGLVPETYENELKRAIQRITILERDKIGLEKYWKEEYAKLEQKSKMIEKDRTKVLDSENELIRNYTELKDKYDTDVKSNMDKKMFEKN